ncbi:DEAD/DEAH box helicase family protein [Metabacillus arenae]|uniref:DEAD/DEAH box helicase family protein n=1 Tax=Metabacillus arenae TaxID=2771434 RepID=A0A926NAF9_9BACI|nr:DEAD/DEAH box helicase family protein [Metabacillus arenae]MBD1379784.1 DEAD/DEAH box helicase family protein [Metabacillus arenae]
MKTFPKHFPFIYEWRSYQQRVLSSLAEHLQNRHLHLIAPPGSGKTVLGLEVMLRLNEPTLILAPTLAIKNQWLERFVELFLNVKEAPDWISMDLKNPNFLTITTYQSLHNVFSDKEEEMNGENFGEVKKEALALIEQIGFKTMILDEAHHLRSAWWKSALEFRKSLSEPNIVALTATPPYDVTLSEWDRYIELCGPIDLEISVPELVQEHDLCPHQDYVYFSVPSIKERETIHSFRKNGDQVRDTLLKDSAFVNILKEHPWITQPDAHLESILSSPSYFSSLLIFLNEAKEIKWKEYVQLLGRKGKSIPKLDLEWLEELLTGCLYNDDYTKKHEELVKRMKKWLNRMGAIERRKVHLRSTKKIDRTLLTSVSKLRSIGDIVEFEAGVLNDELRLVILADYIRLEDLPKNPEDEKPLNRLGVIPIFETLRRKNMKAVRLGVLSGSIAILPKTAVCALPLEWQEDIRLTPLSHDPEYVTVQFTGAQSQKLVRVMTDLFTKGEIHVLTGTTALLGEGWDAPSINSIILASYVGTFMLSNQMRGRAIRVQRGNEGKTSAIWHLVCIDPSRQDCGYDMDTLSRRFKAFVGVSYTGESIENGMDRLSLEPPPFTVMKMNKMNEQMLERASRRNELKNQWEMAIHKNNGDKMVEELKASPEFFPKTLLFTNTIRALIIQGITLGLYIFYNFLERIPFRDVSSLKSILTFLLIGLGVAILFMLPKTFKGLWLWFKHGRIETSSKQLGEVVIHTLSYMKLIESDIKKLETKAVQTFDGSMYFWVNGGTRYEHTLILEAVQEAVGSINNPRYFLKRHSSWGPFKQYDYHAVPQVIGQNKKGAEFFHKQWKKRIGKADLIYARTLAGRKELLKSRMKSISSAFAKKAERVSAWR